LSVLLENVLEESGSLYDLYCWDTFSFQQLMAIVRLTRVQASAETRNAALAL
jgi:hypothetical protein